VTVMAREERKKENGGKGGELQRLGCLQRYAGWRKRKERKKKGVNFLPMQNELREKEVKRGGKGKCSDSESLDKNNKKAKKEKKGKKTAHQFHPFTSRTTKEKKKREDVSWLTDQKRRRRKKKKREKNSSER